MSMVAIPINRLLISTFGLRVVRSLRVGVPFNKAWFDRFFYFQRLFGLVKAVQGDVVECGVAWGTSLAMLAILVRNEENTFSKVLIFNGAAENRK